MGKDEGYGAIPADPAMAAAGFTKAEEEQQDLEDRIGSGKATHFVDEDEDEFTLLDSVTYWVYYILGVLAILSITLSFPCRLYVTNPLPCEWNPLLDVDSFHRTGSFYDSGFNVITNLALCLAILYRVRAMGVMFEEE